VRDLFGFDVLEQLPQIDLQSFGNAYRGVDAVAGFDGATVGEADFQDLALRIDDPDLFRAVLEVDACLSTHIAQRVARGANLDSEVRGEFGKHGWGNMRSSHKRGIGT
jgi:hypothetical protein